MGFIHRAVKPGLQGRIGPARERGLSEKRKDLTFRVLEAAKERENNDRAKES